jgi:hypothetical protein
MTESDFQPFPFKSIEQSHFNVIRMYCLCFGHVNRKTQYDPPPKPSLAPPSFDAAREFYVYRATLLIPHIYVHYCAAFLLELI